MKKGQSTSSKEISQLFETILNGETGVLDLEDAQNKVVVLLEFLSDLHSKDLEANGGIHGGALASGCISLTDDVTTNLLKSVAKTFDWISSVHKQAQDLNTNKKAA